MDNRRTIFNGEGTPGIPYVSFEALDRAGFGSAYTMRFKDGLNREEMKLMRMPTEDPEEVGPVVLANTKALLSRLGADPDMVCITHQKHTANVHTVRENDLGLRPSGTHLEMVDGLVTDIPGAVLIAYGADCPPVYLADPVHNAAGLVHAGRKGTFARIPAAAIDRMKAEYGTDPADIIAVIGPGICESCYEMGDEIFDELCSLWGEEKAAAVMRRHGEGETHPGRFHLDLHAANRMTLIEAGVKPENITMAGVCTCCRSDEFYSYRAARMENEQMAVLVNRG